MPSLEARENAFHFEEADLADNIDENVEEVELEISQIVPRSLFFSLKLYYL